MSRFIKNLARNASKLYYGEVKPSSVGDKIGNFANYLGDTKLRDEAFHDNPEKTNKTSFASSKDNKEESNDSNQTRETNEEPEVVVEDEQPERQEPTKASIPFMITRQMKLDLLELGYSMNDIKAMTPIDAQQILQGKTKK